MAQLFSLGHITRTKNMNIKIMSVILAILSGASLARSQGTLSWQFDSTAFVVEPTDQILLTGTVVNSSDTPYLIQPGGEVASFTGDLQYYYQVSWLLDFLGKTVPADGSLQFDFCTLIPIGGYVQPGIFTLHFFTSLIFCIIRMMFTVKWIVSSLSSF